MLLQYDYSDSKVFYFWIAYEEKSLPEEITRLVLTDHKGPTKVFEDFLDWIYQIFSLSENMVHKLNGEHSNTKPGLSN